MEFLRDSTSWFHYRPKYYTATSTNMQDFLVDYRDYDEWMLEGETVRKEWR